MTADRSPTLASVPLVSDRGAAIAAGRIGCTVAEYRAHEAAGEFWCGISRHWVAWADFHWTGRATQTRGGRCRACARAVARAQYTPQRAVARFLLTPEGVVAVSRADSAWSEPAASCAQPATALSGHSYCHESWPCSRGEVPEGWVREGAP